MPDRLGYELRNTLIDLFDGLGRPAGRRYRLHVTLSRNPRRRDAERRGDHALQRHAERHLFAHRLKGKVITKGARPACPPTTCCLVRPSSTDHLAANYATLAAQQDADKRAADDIAYRIRTRPHVFSRKRLHGSAK